jgi:DNA-binding FadR family transcriptional regulator
MRKVHAGDFVERREWPPPAGGRRLMRGVRRYCGGLVGRSLATALLSTRSVASDEEHRRIVAAIEKRDPEVAEKAAREHILRAQRTRFENTAAVRKRVPAAPP